MLNVTYGGAGVLRYRTITVIRRVNHVSLQYKRHMRIPLFHSNFHLLFPMVLPTSSPSLSFSCSVLLTLLLQSRRNRICVISFESFSISISDISLITI